MHRLIHEGFINPYWLNDVKGKENQATVISKTQIELLGQKLTIGEYYPVKIGETVYVSLYDGNFYFNTFLEKEEEEKRYKQRLEEEKSLELKKRKKRHIEALTFNSRIKLPVKWRSVYKTVLSGLLQNSTGDGRKKNTVVHVLLEEELSDNRFRRKKDELLCTSIEKGKYSVIDAAEEYSDTTYQSKVTCKKCIEILSKKGWLLQ